MTLGGPSLCIHMEEPQLSGIPSVPGPLEFSSVVLVITPTQIISTKGIWPRTEPTANWSRTPLLRSDWLLLITALWLVGWFRTADVCFLLQTGGDQRFEASCTVFFFWQKRSLIRPLSVLEQSLRHEAKEETTERGQQLSVKVFIAPLIPRPTWLWWTPPGRYLLAAMYQM